LIRRLDRRERRRHPSQREARTQHGHEAVGQRGDQIAAGDHAAAAVYVGTTTAMSRATPSAA
jgi:hypothetical protein